jgi:ADP-ribose pyrophosphatase
MSQSKWSRLSQETLFSCAYHDFCHDRYMQPDGAVGDYWYVHLSGSAMIVPRLASGELVLVRQHRYLMERSSLEFPAGGIKRGADPLQTARQELQEETGYVASSWRKIGEFAPCNGLSDELCHVYVASGLSIVGANPEPTEELEVAYFSLSQLQTQVRNGELWDGMTLSSLRIFEAQLVVSPEEE